MLKFISLTFALFLLISSSQAQEFRRISFEEAVNIALEKNIQLRQGKNQLVTLSAEKQQTAMAYLPSASMNFQATRQDGQQFQLVEDGFEIKNVQADRFSGGLNASLTIFDGFSRTHSRKISEHNYNAQLKGVERTKQDVTFQIAQQYLQILLDQELLEISRKAIADQEKQLEQIEGYVEGGLRPKADFYTQQAAVRQFELAAIESENRLAIDKATFAQTLQLDPLDEFQISPFESGSLVELPANGLAEIFETAVNNRLDLQQLEYAVASSKRNIALSKSAYYPSLAAFYQYGTQYSSLNTLEFREQFFDLYPNNTVGLSLQIPLFNNFVNKTRVESAKVNLANNTLNQEDLRRTIFRDVQNAYLNYEAAVKRMEVTEAGLAASKQAYEVQKQRYDVGVADFVELSQANQLLVQAASDDAQAKFTVVFQKLIVEYSAGILDVNELN